MAKSPILDYIKEKLNASGSLSEKKETKVITISREYGCPGIPVANEVVKALSSQKEWTVVDKEIIKQAAQEFDISPKLLDEIAKSKPKGIFEELFLSFSDVHLPSDIKVRKAIARILRTVALHGNVVILGQGGVVLARDIKKSLHVHLHASPSWRLKRVKELEKISSDTEAMGRINVVDNERIFLRNYFAGETLNSNIFDVSYNCEFLSEKEIVDSILKLAESKGI